MRRAFSLILPAFLAALGLATGFDAAGASGPLLKLPGMKLGGTITRGDHDIPAIWGITEWDLFYLQGYVQAEDRLFQMDVSRRTASGTLAELLGPAALPQDVQLRTLGLRRAAVGSLDASSAEVHEVLAAYAAGVNQWVVTHTLPPEYGALELTKFEPWTPLDSSAIAKLFLFSLSFDLDTSNTVTLLTYIQAGKVAGFDGMKLFSNDLFRSAPFDPFTTIPVAPSGSSMSPVRHETASAGALDEMRARAEELLASGTLDLVARYEERARAVPLLRTILDHERTASSNEWAISGRLAANGVPLLANDPHLSLGTPPIWYPLSLRGPGINVAGNSFAGTPFAIHGHNDRVAWGSTVNPMDMTDTFQETIAPAPGSLTGYGTVYQGHVEPLLVAFETFRMNNPGNGVKDDIVVVPPVGSIPPVTLIVPRRDYGAIITPDTLATGSALSVQYVGFGRTRELDAVLGFNKARTLADFKRALRYFDGASQNWAIATLDGDIAYYASGELPLREDLQANTVHGLPPWFIRDGTGGNEWLPASSLPEDQAVPHAILPADEIPHVENPAQGWFANGNNDPVGTSLHNDPLGTQRPGGGIFYLNPAYDGYRGGRIAQLIRAKLANGGKISLSDMQKIQSDTGMIDAQFFVPFITAAFANAQAPGANPVLASFTTNPAVASAVARLGTWDFTTPTGLKEGYDAGKAAGVDPTPDQAKASAAATIYALWRSRFIANTIDGVLGAASLPTPPNALALTALRNLLEQFGVRGGFGESGVNFFNVSGVASASDRRDIIILKSVSDGLALLAGDGFAAAYGHSTNLDDYRWGKLHRIVFEHPLGGAFNVPSSGGAFPNPLGDGLPGIPRQGGFEVIDRSDNDARGKTVNGFMFNAGPSRRYACEAGPGSISAQNSLPGGVSGVLGDPNYFSILPLWLTNQTYPMEVQTGPRLPWQ
jgi:penicillin amidase